MKFDFLTKKEQNLYIEKAATLVEALPYMREHSAKKIVIKYGGHAMGNQNLSESFSKDVGLIKEVGINPIIVHGGGPQIGQMLNRKKIKTTFVEGLRVTDKKTMKVVKEVLFNIINKKIVNDINTTGGKAIGLAGHQNNLIVAEKYKIKIKNNSSHLNKFLDIGFVGKPKSINKKIINDKISKNMIPVISPLGRDNNNIYNINADTVAGFIAEKLKANKLLLLTDVPGILDNNNKLISSLSLKEAKKLIKKNFIVDGMKPKIQTCIEALEQGVKEATILDGRIPHSLILELFTEHGIGTQIYS